MVLYKSLPLAQLSQVCSFAYTVPAISNALPCISLPPSVQLLLLLHSSVPAASCSQGSLPPLNPPPGCYQPLSEATRRLLLVLSSCVYHPVRACLTLAPGPAGTGISWPLHVDPASPVLSHRLSQIQTPGCESSKNMCMDHLLNSASWFPHL